MSTKPLDMLESLLSITEQFTEGETQFDNPAMKEWYRISAATANLREAGEPGINASERGNILLAHDEEFYLNAWIRLPDSQWLQIAYRNDNYPALEVSTITSTDEALAAHINKEFGGGLWSVRKLNIDGVNVKDNHIVGDDD
jgi:hypothetical protein